MKQKYIPIILIILAVVGSIAFAIYDTQKAPKSEASDAPTVCKTTGKTHTLTIEGNKFNPEELDLKRCERIKVVNKDNVARLIALGEHDHHIAYPGFEEQSMGSGDSFTFTADKAGKYLIHDHVHDEVEGVLSISK
jgi:plastocyanin